MIQKISLACAVVCFTLILSAVKAQGQIPAPRSYLFVEIKETSGQPVTDATVAVYGADGKKITGLFTTTDAKFTGSLPIRSDHHFNVLVSKQGFQPSEHVFFSTPYGEGTRLVEKMPLGHSAEISTIVLRKRPTTVSEQKIFDEQELQTQMILAAKRCDLLRMSKLLQLGVSADAIDADGVSALLWATFAGDADTINALLEAGAHVRPKNPRDAKVLLIYLAEGIVRDQKVNTSPDEMAERFKRAVLVSRLIKAGADVNAKDPQLGTVLNAALRVVSTSLPAMAIDDLVKTGANVNAPDEPQLSTPLMWASQSGSIETVKTLLAAGAAVDVKDKAGRTALMWAQVARKASEQFNSEIVNTLIKAGAKVNVTDENGNTPLILAAQADLTESVRMLLAAGALVNAKNRWGSNALISAFDSHYRLTDKDTHHPAPLTIRALLTAGADIQAGNSDGTTPLMLAARTDSLEAVKMLLEAGASIDGRDKKGKTALMYERYGYMPSVETFKVLVAAKGDLNAVDSGGRTPLMYAAKGGPPEILELLLKNGAKPSINARDNSGQTALMYAAYYSDFTFPPEDQLRNVKALLEAGADVNIKDNSGNTALGIAQAYSRNQAVIVLLKSKQSN
jgi:ankyrin repeat protein